MTSNSFLPLLVRTAKSSSLTRANAAFEETFGLSNEELAASSLLSWIHPDDRSAFEVALAAGCGCIHARHRSSDGSWLPVDWEVRDEGGELYALGRLSENPHDSLAVTEIPFAPDQESLSKVLDAMALIVESTNPGMRCSILLIDKATNRVSVGAGPSLPDEYNAAVEGLQIGPLVGSCGTAAYWGVPVVVENIQEDFLWRDLRHAADLAGVRACWSQPIRATNGEILGAMALYNNVPAAPERHHMDGLEIAARMVGLAIERNRLEQKLRQAAKMEALGVLAGGIAHDFNNLMAVVLGNAEIAKGKIDSDHDAQRMLAAILRATDGATSLCNQLLAYAGRGALATETLDCNALIGDLAELLQVTLSKKATLEYDLQGELHVVADRSQLRQVVLNLITNASEAIGNAEGRLLVRTRERRLEQRDLALLGTDAPATPGEYVELVVSDSGCGMSAETQARIFDPFFTTKADGRGLGLAAVLGIVRAHGGALRLKSSPGEGTAFTVLLPRAPRGAEVGGTPDEPANAIAGARILIVDDEPEVLAILSESLSYAGLVVAEASNGEEAIARFRKDPDAFDCVLLDLSMPKLDGEEVFHELRRIRPDVRVVLSSGYTEQEVLNRFTGAGLAGVIQKPAHRHVLLAKVEEAIRSGSRV